MLSSSGNSFNMDLQVEQPPQQADAKWYNYGSGWISKQRQYPGISVFHKGDDGSVYHTYSAYSRGLDQTNAFHALADLLPYGRDGFFPHHKEDYKA